MSTILHDLSASLAEWVAQSQDSVVRVEARRPRAASGLVWSADGVVLTASHVIQREDKINVTLPDGAVLPATLIGKDASTDLVALRIAATGLPVLPRAGMQNLAVGHLALGLGRPGQKIQATYGPIGALGEKWRTPWGGVLDVFLRTEIDLPPGFSGGPLLNTQGELLGMNSAALSRHLNLAVPVGTLQRVTGELLQYGRVRRGYLGIGVQPVVVVE